MNRKIKQYSALAVASASILPLACKKETNSPDIEDKTINKLIKTFNIPPSSYFAKDSIDINGDGIFDLKFIIGGGVYITTYANAYMEGISGRSEILSNSESFLGTSYFMATPKNKGDKINESAVTWKNYGLFGIKQNDNLTGIAGAGDKFYGFRFKNGVNLHYGWIKIAVASDFRSLTIKELAYHKSPDTEIEVGQK